MQIDKTTTVTGGGLYGLDLEFVEISLALDPAPALLLAEVLPTTVSISHMFIDSGDPGGGIDPDPDPSPYLFYGVDSQTFGFGGAPPYNACYPLNGLIGE